MSEQHKPLPFSWVKRGMVWLRAEDSPSPTIGHGHLDITDLLAVLLHETVHISEAVRRCYLLKRG
jgi:hypothetical protein